MGRGIFLALIAYFSLIGLSYGLLYSVMPDPEDDCRDCSEWLMLKSESSVNISGYVVDLGGKNVSIASLECSGLNKESFSGELVLADDRQKFLDLFCLNPGGVVVCDVETSLNNDGDFVGVFDSSGLIEGGSYESADKNQTFCYSNSGFSSCEVNVCGRSFGGSGNVSGGSRDVVITNNLLGELSVGKRYTSIYNIELKGKGDCSNKDEVVVSYYLEDKDGERIADEGIRSEVGCTKSADTGEIIVLEEGVYKFCAQMEESSFTNSNLSNDGFCVELDFSGEYERGCDLELELDVESSILNLGERQGLILDILGLEDEEFSLEYWVEDLSGNIVKDKLNTSNLDEKSFTPKDVVGEKEFLFKGVLYPECRDGNLADNYDEEKFLVIGSGGGHGHGVEGEEEHPEEIVEAGGNESAVVVSAENIAEGESGLEDVQESKEGARNIQKDDKSGLGKITGKAIGGSAQASKEKTIVRDTQILSAKNIFIFVLIVLVGVLLVSK